MCAVMKSVLIVLLCASTGHHHIISTYISYMTGEDTMVLYVSTFSYRGHSELIRRTWDWFCQVDGVDVLSLSFISFVLFHVTFVGSVVASVHILQIHRQVTILQLRVLQLHPVLKRGMLVVRIRVPIPEKEDIQ